MRPIRPRRDLDLEALVEAQRAPVLDQRPDGVEIGAAGLADRRVVVGQRAEELVDAVIEVGHVVGDVDDALEVDLGVAHPHRVAEGRRGSLIALSPASR